jgi:hypothetical protein
MESKEDRLNLLNESFEPELALSSKMVTLLVPEVHCLDNLSKCRILLDDPTAELYKRKAEVKISRSLLRRSQYIEHKRRRLERYRIPDQDWLSLHSPEGFFERLASKNYFLDVTDRSRPVRFIFNWKTPVIHIDYDIFRGTSNGPV